MLRKSVRKFPLLLIWKISSIVNKAYNGEKLITKIAEKTNLLTNSKAVVRPRKQFARSKNDGSDVNCYTRHGISFSLHTALNKLLLKAYGNSLADGSALNQQFGSFTFERKNFQAADMYIRGIILIYRCMLFWLLSWKSNLGWGTTTR